MLQTYCKLLTVLFGQFVDCKIEYFFTFAIVEVSKDTIEKFEEKRYEYEIYSIYLTFLHSAMFTNYLISINLSIIN